MKLETRKFRTAEREMHDQAKKWVLENLPEIDKKDTKYQREVQKMKKKLLKESQEKKN